MVTTRPRTARRQGQDVRFLTLTRDGRLRDEALIPRLLEAGRAATDYFVFCRGWPYDDGEAKRQVERPIVVMRSDHGRALRQFSTLVPSGAAVPKPTAPGGRGHARTVVATSTIGVAGVRGVGAPGLTLAEVGRVGLPQYPVVNVDGTALVKAGDVVGGAHGDICRPEIATLILLAGGLLQGGPDGIRPPRLDPIIRA
jgi:hypothetical protein